MPRPYIFGPRAVDASESISQCRPRQWTAAAYGQEEIGEASYRRPRRDEVQRVDADLREKAREAVAMAKEMGDLEKGVDEMEASKKRIQIAVKKVQAFRTVLELHFGRENLEKVGDEMQGARGARRYVTLSVFCVRAVGYSLGAVGCMEGGSMLELASRGVNGPTNVAGRERHDEHSVPLALRGCIRDVSHRG